MTADTDTTNLTISGNGADSVFGTTTASSLTNATLGALSGTLTVQVGSATAQTITFGSGGGQVNTRAELTTALSGLTGVTATIARASDTTNMPINNGNRERGNPPMTS